MTLVHPQLQSLDDEFAAATARLQRLAAEVPAAVWGNRAAPDRWSVGECVSHLILTAKAYEPIVTRGLADARALGGPAPVRYRRDLAGWLLWRMVTPVPRLRMPTTASFVPAGVASKDDALADFFRWQQAQRSWVAQADGLPIQRVKVPSAFNERLSYNLFACFTILPRHQHRHLHQAEEVWRTLRG